ncbi:hypothetical protein GCM10007164_24340 [Luteimonas padinae]|nr:hypothetical protein GCM10007164_24340 [Luteimonas padinae]
MVALGCEIKEEAAEEWGRAAETGRRGTFAPEGNHAPPCREPPHENHVKKVTILTI